MQWLGARERATLLCLVLISAGLWGFVELADEVMEGQTDALDRAILLAMREPDDPSELRGGRWLAELARDVTALGSVGVLTLLAASVAGFLALVRRTRTMIFLVIAVTGGFAISFLLKGWFARPRPDVVPHAMHVYTMSFPSGHAMMAAVTYLTLGALLARTQPQPLTKAYLLLLSMLLTVLIGISRVYLGVHWPTDVLAGWTVGACWALMCWTGARYLQRKGQLEGPLQTPVEDDP